MEILIFLYTVMDHGRLMIKKNPLAHMKALESFEFLYSIITLQRSLSYQMPSLKFRARIKI